MVESHVCRSPVGLSSQITSGSFGLPIRTIFLSPAGCTVPVGRLRWSRRWRLHRNCRTSPARTPQGYSLSVICSAVTSFQSSVIHFSKQQNVRNHGGRTENVPLQETSQAVLPCMSWFPAVVNSSVWRKCLENQPVPRPVGLSKHTGNSVVIRPCAGRDYDRRGDKNLLTGDRL